MCDGYLSTMRVTAVQVGEGLGHLWSEHPEQRQLGLLEEGHLAAALSSRGGHLEPEDVSLAGAALREATEESGLTGLVVEAEPLQLSSHSVAFCDPRGPVDHLDVRFLATAPRDGEHPVSEEALDVRRWPVDGLPDGYEDMRRLVADAVARLTR